MHACPICHHFLTQPMESLFLNTFGDSDGVSSPWPEFDEAAQIGRGGSVERCQKTYHKCSLTSQDLKFKAMYFK